MDISENFHFYVFWVVEFDYDSHFDQFLISFVLKQFPKFCVCFSSKKTQKICKFQHSHQKNQTQYVKPRSRQTKLKKNLDLSSKLRI